MPILLNSFNWKKKKCLKIYKRHKQENINKERINNFDELSIFNKHNIN